MAEARYDGIADWYDASVGGHQMKDISRGRIYRLAPIGYKPAPVAVDLRTDAGLSAALRSPAQSVRYRLPRLSRGAPTRTVSIARRDMEQVRHRRIRAATKPCGRLRRRRSYDRRPL